MIDMRRRDFISGMAAFAAMPPFVAFAEGTNCAQSASVQIHRNEERQSELLTKWNAATEAGSQKDYGQYLRRLSRIRSEDRKIGYAYRTLCRLYKRAAPEISASDTPREVQRKAERTARFASSDLESVRKIIERVKFEDAALAEHEKSGLLGELCRNVRILI